MTEAEGQTRAHRVRRRGARRHHDHHGARSRARLFSNAGFEPTNLSRTTVVLFFTRWITHFCAPVFFLLTGTGAYLSLKKQSQSKLSWFLFTRGIWLIFLELTVYPLPGMAVQFRLSANGVDRPVGVGLVHDCAFGAVLFAGSVGGGLRGGHDCGAQSAGWRAVRNPIWSILHSPNLVWSN